MLELQERNEERKKKKQEKKKREKKEKTRKNKKNWPASGNDEVGVLDELAIDPANAILDVLADQLVVLGLGLGRLGIEQMSEQLAQADERQEGVGLAGVLLDRSHRDVWSIVQEAHGRTARIRRMQMQRQVHLTILIIEWCRKQSKQKNKKNKANLAMK